MHPNAQQMILDIEFLECIGQNLQHRDSLQQLHDIQTLANWSVRPMSEPLSGSDAALPFEWIHLSADTAFIP